MAFDLTIPAFGQYRDEFDFEFEPYDVECARCGVTLSCEDACAVESGDGDWECESCNIRCDAKEYYDRGEYVHVDIYILESGYLQIASDMASSSVEQRVPF